MLFSTSQALVPRILVIDDDSATNLILTDLLGSLGKVDYSESASQGLQKALTEPYELIMLDIEMPEMDGFDVFQRLQVLPAERMPAIIFITSHKEAHYAKQSFELGGVDFINKPFDPALCRLRVKNHLRLKRQQNALLRARQDINELISNIPVYISYWSDDLFCGFSNDRAGAWFALSAEKSVGLKMNEVFPEVLHSAIRNNLHSLSPHIFDVTVVENEVKRHLQVTIQKRGISSEGEGYIISISDISVTKRAKLALLAEKEKLNVMLRSIGDAVIATDTDGYITFMNPIAETMTGISLLSALGSKIENVMKLEDSTTHDTMINPVYIALREKRTVAMALNCQILSDSGRVYKVEDSAAPIVDEDGGIIGAIIVFHDISEFVAMSVKMTHMANYDQLTNLPNRMLLHDRANQAIRAASQNNLNVALFVIDLDFFKYVNDSIGHHIGDALIVAVATRLKDNFYGDTTISRIGGDEFVVLVPDVAELGSLLAASNRIQKAFSHPVKIENQTIKLSASIGGSVFPTDANTAEQLIIHADAAMFKAKEMGRNRLVYFSDDIETEYAARLSIEKLLRHTLEHEGVTVHFQPKHNLKTKTLVGVEALVRLTDTNNALIYPDAFITLAEETGLINELGKVVLTHSAILAKALHQSGHMIPVAVNISAKQIQNPDFIALVKQLIDDFELADFSLEFELTESALMEEFDNAQKVLAELAELKIKIAVDDFGTGYSSLSYLKFFPVDVLKIDKSFVMDMFDDPQDMDIVNAVIQLGKSLKLELVAEGIESEKHCKMLHKLGCTIGQGYWFSKPLSNEAFLSYVSE